MQSQDQKASPVATTINKALQCTDSTNKTSVNRDNHLSSEPVDTQEAKANLQSKEKELSTKKMLQEISDIQKKLKESIDPIKEDQQVGNQVMGAEDDSDGSDQLCRRKRKARVLEDSDEE